MSKYQFHIGQKVVCIQTHSQRIVVKDATYTIDAIKACTCGVVAARLVGVYNSPGHKGCYCLCGRDLDNSDAYINTRILRPIDALTEQVERIEKEGAPVELQTVAA